MAEINEMKEGIQDAALGKWYRTGRKGTIAGATGVGKSRIAIRAIQDMLADHHFNQAITPPRILILVPTEALRDENWPAELRKWCATQELYDTLMECVTLECYASSGKIRAETFDLLILDEAHHMTELVERIFLHNQFRSILGLTATPPDIKRDPEKHRIFMQYFPVIFQYSLDQGVEDGVVADFEIVIIMEGLDNITKNIQGGTAKKPFMTTEARQYAYLDNVVKRTMAMAAGPNKENAMKFNILRRTRFIYNLPSKTALAKALLAKLPAEARIITFCGSIEQSRELFGTEVYNSKDKKHNKLEEFKNDLTMKRLGVVNAVDEGHNIEGMDMAVIVQTNSNNRTIVQRLGRIVRVRPGHKAQAFLICAAGTQDEKWVKTALADFDQSRIKVIHSREIYSGSFFENP